jgi:hypothetical protein
VFMLMLMVAGLAQVLEERCRQFNESYREKMEKDVEATLDSLQNAVIFIQDTLIGGQVS